MKKFVCSVLVVTLFLGMSTGVFAHGMDVEKHSPTVSESPLSRGNNHTVKSVGTVVTSVQLRAWMPHRNDDTSYERTVIRQGKKHVIRYEAAPKSSCKYCKMKEY